VQYLTTAQVSVKQKQQWLLALAPLDAVRQQWLLTVT
jgi:hypothetical protein